MHASISSPFGRPAGRRGFTLLEMCIVLVIIALLAALAMPAMNSAFAEQALRNDTHRLAVMVKTGMNAASEQGRPWKLTLDGKELTLAPAAPSADDAPADIDAAADSEQLGNPIKFPDADKQGAWESLPTVAWTFWPNDLCPLPRVRVERGRAYIEMSFNALTGDVENEASYLP